MIGTLCEVAGNAAAALYALRWVLVVGAAILASAWAAEAGLR